MICGAKYGININNTYSVSSVQYALHTELLYYDAAKMPVEPRESLKVIHPPYV